jgi:Domain of unknown function (DUF4386)
MDLYRRSGLVTGILFIVATVAGVLSLSAQSILGSADYLSKISANEQPVLLSALLIFVMGWAGTGISVAMYPVLRKYGHGMAIGAVAFRTIEGAFHCLGAVLVLLLATLSREFIKGGGVEAAHFQRIGILLLEGRNWASDVAALPSWCIGAFLYYSLFYRARLVPRWLSLWGLVGIALTAASSLLVMFGKIAPMSTAQLVLNLPIAPQEIVLAIWLIVKGFAHAPILNGKTGDNE